MTPTLSILMVSLREIGTPWPQSADLMATIGLDRCRPDAGFNIDHLKGSPMTTQFLSRRFTLLAAASMIVSSGMAWADTGERGTRPEAKALSEAAAAHVDKVGSEQAFKDFSADPKWSPKDMYVFAQSMDATMIFHGANAKLVGKNFAEVKDTTGKQFNKEMIAAANKGSGWVDYQWANPVSKKVEDKTSHIVRINKPSGFVGVGIYR